MILYQGAIPSKISQTPSSDYPPPIMESIYFKGTCQCLLFDTPKASRFRHLPFRPMAQ